MGKARGEKGWHMTPNRLSRAGKVLSCAAYRVYGVIASFKPSHPSYTRIQKDSGIARASVSAAIRELSQYNILYIKKKGSSTGFANEYCINPPEKWTLPSSEDELVQNLNQFTEETTTSSDVELVQDVNQFNTRTRASSRAELELVQDLNSNNTNIIIPNKKTNTADGVLVNGGSAHLDTPTPTQDDTPTADAFDFEALYALFPKRGKDMKKSLGMQKCKAQIRNQEQYEKLKSAVLNYDQHVKEQKRKRSDFDNSFIKTWGHFMSKTYWVDWVSVNGHSEKKEIINPLREDTCKPNEESIL